MLSISAVKYVGTVPSVVACDVAYILYVSLNAGAKYQGAGASV